MLFEHSKDAWRMGDVENDCLPMNGACSFLSKFQAEKGVRVCTEKHKLILTDHGRSVTYAAIYALRPNYSYVGDENIVA